MEEHRRRYMLIAGLPGGGILWRKTRSPTCSRIGPRLGYAVDRWMVYGTGGYAAGTIKGG